MQNCVSRTAGGRTFELRFLSALEARRGRVTYQVWAVLPDGRHVLVGEAVNRDWAERFVRMVPQENHQGKINVVVVETNGGNTGPKAVPGKVSAAHRHEMQRRRLSRRQGGRIDWASYGQEE